MSYSLNEIQALALKATRGMGYEWGEAEEAAWAIRWLIERNADGTAALVQTLNESAASAVIVTQGVHFQSSLRRAIAFADGAHQWTMPVELTHVETPLLLLPFIARFAQYRRNDVDIRVKAAVARIVGNELAYSGNWLNAGTVTILDSVSAMVVTTTRKCRAHPQPQHLQLLGKWAHRTLAPATDDSRLSGAGAGESDND